MTNAVSEKVSARGGAETPVPTAVRAKVLLDLEGDAPPPPRQLRYPVKNVRMPADLLTWLREQAYQEGVTVNAEAVRILQAARAGARWPADVQEWLLRQAAQCGVPGDPDLALVLVVRHLAARWPDGCRLRG